ncbi:MULTISPECIES: hypothetical protein [unclassified Streptomyces]|uniref:hypothetical protein n=1 Tax=unclassified Streptomyces TaxID=2593676 RepID=UPI0023666264|nr:MULTISPECIES: hypothetical protein [unclassified Streptomyces]MDF3139934.1 hypothetical protein [Streptomyces sp. T21Q-yed]WDF44020.1 hypothetical protein PBV52_48185 [Streptomyces sp. T12]
MISTAVALAACVPSADPDLDPDPGYRELTYAEQALVERAEALLTKRCMEKEGFRYWIGPIASIAERQGGGYVLSDLGWARKYGYGTGLEEQANKNRLADPNNAYAGKLSRPELIRYNTALDGSPGNGWVSVDLPGGGTVQTTAGGCRAQALDRLYGDFRAWFHADRTAENLKPLYAPDIVKDTRFKRALTAWAACMNKAGHPYADPPRPGSPHPGAEPGRRPGHGGGPRRRGGHLRHGHAAAAHGTHPRTRVPRREVGAVPRRDRRPTAHEPHRAGQRPGPLGSQGPDGSRQPPREPLTTQLTTHKKRSIT